VRSPEPTVPLASPETGLSQFTASRRALLGVTAVVAAVASPLSAAFPCLCRAGGTAETQSLKRTPFLRPAAFSLLGFSSFSLAVAAEQPLLLDEQVSTATRTSQDGIAATTVIDREQIERSQATSVPELLRRVPGVSLVNNGGPGKSTSVSLRGSNSNHVLVLIDGIRVGSATTGDAAFQNLPVELIERIEVVRGPRSGLYGSDAIGGGGPEGQRERRRQAVLLRRLRHP